jgi:hypothetical protein
VHHSIELEHRDMNFGVLFSVWDRIFKTRCADADTYPQTGVHDPGFPMERSAAPIGLTQTLFRQLLHPIAELWRTHAGSRVPAPRLNPNQ